MIDADIIENLNTQCEFDLRRFRIFEPFMSLDVRCDMIEEFQWWEEAIDFRNKDMCEKMLVVDPSNICFFDRRELDAKEIESYCLYALRKDPFVLEHINNPTEKVIEFAAHQLINADQLEEYIKYQYYHYEKIGAYYEKINDHVK